VDTICLTEALRWATVLKNGMDSGQDKGTDHGGRAKVLPLWQPCSLKAAVLLPVLETYLIHKEDKS